MIRQEYNKKILRIIAEMVELYPDWRFHQILENLNITAAGEDRFYEESLDTLNNISLVSD